VESVTVILVAMSTDLRTNYFAKRFKMGLVSYLEYLHVEYLATLEHLPNTLVCLAPFLQGSGHGARQLMPER
jgi:hypothetical protein